MARRFLTEYAGDEGTRWDGPIILADSPEMAKALTVCLLAPNGRRLAVVGELVNPLSMDLSDLEALPGLPN